MVSLKYTFKTWCNYPPPSKKKYWRFFIILWKHTFCFYLEYNFKIYIYCIEKFRNHIVLLICIVELNDKITDWCYPCIFLQRLNMSPPPNHFLIHPINCFLKQSKSLILRNPGLKKRNILDELNFKAYTLHYLYKYNIVNVVKHHKHILLLKIPNLNADGNFTLPIYQTVHLVTLVTMIDFFF